MYVQCSLNISVYKQLCYITTKISCKTIGVLGYNTKLFTISMIPIYIENVLDEYNTNKVIKLQEFYYNHNYIYGK